LTFYALTADVKSVNILEHSTNSRVIASCCSTLEKEAGQAWGLRYTPPLLRFAPTGRPASRSGQQQIVPQIFSAINHGKLTHLKAETA